MSYAFFDIADNAAAFDKETKALRPLAAVPRPEEGWVKKVRTMLGMTGKQLATRMDTIQSGVSNLERLEREGGVTLRRMDEAAQAMGCQFVYAIIPEGMTASAMVEGRTTLMTQKLYKKEMSAARFTNDRVYLDKLKRNKRRYINSREFELLQTFGLLWKDEWIEGV